jgi:hypothetical protein
VRAYLSLGMIFERTNALTNAEEVYRRAIALCQQPASSPPDERMRHYLLASGELDLGNVLAGMRYTDAERAYLDAVSLFEGLGDRAPTRPSASTLWARPSWPWALCCGVPIGAAMRSAYSAAPATWLRGSWKLSMRQHVTRRPNARLHPALVIRAGSGRPSAPGDTTNSVRVPVNRIFEQVTRTAFRASRPTATRQGFTYAACYGTRFPLAPSNLKGNEPKGGRENFRSRSPSVPRASRCPR